MDACEQLDGGNVDDGFGEDVGMVGDGVEVEDVMERDDGQGGEVVLLLG